MRPSVVRVGGAVGREETQFENEVGCVWRGDELVAAPILQGCVKLVVGAIGIAAEWMRKQATVCSGV